MPVRVINPIEDPAWSALLDRHPSASVFHTPAWLSALRQTYGYEPFVVTTSPGPTLHNGIVLCRVKGWRSRRLVSLPFSDHCDPLVDDPATLQELTAHLMSGPESFELRPRSEFDMPLEAAGAYHFHALDLRAGPYELFHGMHPSSTQRAVRRAEREGLTCESGTSEVLLASFYRLLRMTRRRHGVPPQPLAWFRNLITNMGGRLAIHTASMAGRPVASILTLSFKNTMVYKYGGSDAAHHYLGGMPFLFWQVIQTARRQGIEGLDLGRSDVNQPGLAAFKEHLGATRSTLTYYRHPDRGDAAAFGGFADRVARGVFSYLPDTALDVAGRLLYKHLG